MLHIASASDTSSKSADWPLVEFDPHADEGLVSPFFVKDEPQSFRGLCAAKSGVLFLVPRLSMHFAIFH